MDYTAQLLCQRTGRMRKRTVLKLVLLLVVIFSVSFIEHVIHVRRLYREKVRQVELQCRRSNRTVRRDEIQPVDHHNLTYVFSAYKDFDGDRPIVRILGITHNRENAPLNCVLWRNCCAEIVEATIEKIPEDHGFNYSATFFVCPVSLSYGTATHVTVISSRSVGLLNRLEVGTSSAESEVNFTMCLPPLQDNYNNVHQLLEYVIVNRLFGANLFVFYNNSMSARVSRALEMFMSQGLAEVIPWRIPQHVLQDIHYCAQLLAINDCMYRHRHRTRFIASTDLDEFIVPRKSDSWMSMIQPVIKAVPSAGAYYIRSYIFCTTWSDHAGAFAEKETALKLDSKTLLKTNRSVLALPPFKRQKYIFDPKRLKTAGIHFMWTAVGGTLEKFTDTFIDIEEASLNHYRGVSPGTYRPDVPETYMTDTYMHRFQGQIAVGLVKQWEKLNSRLGRV